MSDRFTFRRAGAALREGWSRLLGALSHAGPPPPHGRVEPPLTRFRVRPPS